MTVTRHVPFKNTLAKLHNAEFVIVPDKIYHFDHRLQLITGATFCKDLCRGKSIFDFCIMKKGDGL